MLLASVKECPQWRDIVAEKLVKSELVGADITVIRASCQSVVGLSGVIIKETQNTFILVDKACKPKRVLKCGSVFRLKLPTDLMYPKGTPELAAGKVLVVDLWGDMLAVKSKKGRAKANFKERKAALHLYN